MIWYMRLGNLRQALSSRVQTSQMQDVQNSEKYTVQHLAYLADPEKIRSYVPVQVAEILLAVPLLPQWA